MRYVLTDGQTHEVDSSSMAFMIATKYSSNVAFEDATPTILEPIMDVEVTVPIEYQGGIMN
jgi:elongation factor G